MLVDCGQQVARDDPRPSIPVVTGLTLRRSLRFFLVDPGPDRRKGDYSPKFCASFDLTEVGAQLLTFVGKPPSFEHAERS